MNTIADSAASTRLDPALVHQARASAGDEGRPVIEVLEELSGLAPREFMAVLAHSLDMPLLAPAELESRAPDFSEVSFALASQRRCVIVAREGGGLDAVMGDPFNTDLREWARFSLPRGARPVLAHPKDISAYLSKQEEALSAMDGFAGTGDLTDEVAETIDDLSLSAISADTSPVVRLVSSTLYDALKATASDIHLESNAAGLAIKYRIDGVLVKVGQVAGTTTAQQIVSRIKVLSELDISETRVPQDGRFKVAVRGRPVDLRVSVMPSIFGEDVVMRVLDKQTLADEAMDLRLEALGLDEDSIRQIRRLSNEPYGMVLVTGPTGSGKTTTLYAALTEINHGSDKIVTIEDPVEYQLPGVLQIPVNERKGLTFARGLRSILRHDPDKILVGEIRDPETAQIAVQSALTGHLVFTSVHANSAFDVISRFKHMGVDPYSFVSALNGIVAQRLVRLNCPDCSQPHRPEAAALIESGLRDADVSGYTFMAGSGCGTCRGTGFRGRRAIAEFLIMDDELRELVVDNAPIRRIKEAARQRGTRLLREAALELVRTGQTTLQEINRVTFVS